MQRTALLRHETDAGTHLDWLLERPGGGRLITFRLQVRIDMTGEGPWRAHRIEDHRPLYLGYEGAISGGRGHVRRLASGRCRVVEESADHLRAWVKLGRLRGEIAGERTASSEWLFERRTAVPAALGPD